jgi:pimeloyl-ACP methyl ester carboxylesterase
MQARGDPMAASVVALLLLAVLSMGSASSASAGELQVRSRDGTPIAFECSGSGPELLIVHGGTGDRTRWLPMLPYLSKDFTVCAMDRRAHGRSGDTLPYSLQKEAEDIAAVVQSRGRPVTVLGHSFGGVAVYEAALITPAISRLILYEPPIAVGDDSKVLDQMELLIASGDRDGATRAFMTGIVGVSPAGLARMQAQPSWPKLAASIDYSARQHRALMAYRWDPAGAKAMHKPVLLISGSRTTGADLLDSLKRLSEALPNRQLITLEGQEHNAMDDDRERLASVIRDFLLTSR